MKVILLQDVKGTGKKDDIVEVSDGFARNMLFKKKLAKEATSVEVNSLKIKKESQEFHKQEEIKRIKAEAKRVMRTVLDIYGDYAPADYYLDLYDTGIDEVEYVQMMPNLKVPHTERFRRYKLLEEYSKLSKDDFDNALDNTG